MMLRASAFVPPMMLPLAPAKMPMPAKLLRAGVAVGNGIAAAGIRADVIAENDVAGGVRVGDENAVLRVAGNDIARSALVPPMMLPLAPLAMRIP